MIGDGVTTAMESDQHENKVTKPSDKQRGHEPVTEFENVIDLIAMLGSVRRLTEKFVYEGEATHIDRVVLQPIVGAALTASSNAARCDT